MTSTYQPGDVIVIAFPFPDASGSKLRPALVLLDTGDADVVVAPITSRPHSSPHEVVLAHWRAAGLNVPSTVRLHKVATVERSLIHRRLGYLHRNDRLQVASDLDSTWHGVVVSLQS
jgi:mRNA interferase MazF